MLSRKIVPDYIYLFPGLTSNDLKTINNNYLLSHVNTYNDVTNLVVHRVVRNRKSWISQRTKYDFSMKRKKFLTYGSDGTLIAL